MAVLQAKKVRDSLAKARRVGLIEEPVTLSGCNIVLRSLPPEAYESINNDTHELEDIEYLHAYQLGHLSRAIVEIDGVDLRDVDFVEVDEELPDGKVRTVKLEKHVWLRDYYLKTWGREVVLSGWRKFAELLVKAEEKAKEGIVFSIAEESSEDKFRRLLGELTETGAELPSELSLRILDEAGFMLKSSKEELEQASQTLSEIKPDKPEEAVTEPAPAPEPSRVPEPARVAEPSRAAEPVADLNDKMRDRVPMNRGAVEIPQPRAQDQVAAPSVSTPVPAQIRDAAISSQSLSRSAQIANVEGVDPSTVHQVPPSRETVELRRPDPAGRGEIKLDPPPVGGINPRFHRR